MLLAIFFLLIFLSCIGASHARRAKMRPLATVVAWSVCLSVCLGYNYEPIRIPFGAWTRVEPGNHVLRGGPGSPRRKGSFGGIVLPIVEHGEYPATGVRSILPTLLGRWQQVNTTTKCFIVIMRLCLAACLAEWLACWIQAQKGPGSYRSRDAVG